jgi:hypothetical protein
MKKRDLIIIIVASVFTLIFVLPSAWAGSPQQYRWEGVAIGVGAAIVGSVLLNNCLYAHPPARVAYRYASPPHYRYYYPLPRHRRNWVVGKRWIPNRSPGAWSHGHYYRHGR